MITSLLSLQADTSASQETTDALQDAAARITTILRLYEKLFLSGDYSYIDMQSFISDIVYGLRETYLDAHTYIKLMLSIDTIHFETDTAIPLAIIVNELVTNAFKYAFPNDEGEVCITLHQDPDSKDNYTLIVKDNGEGFCTTKNWEINTGFGLQLVKAEVKQIGGDLTIESSPGVTAAIHFKTETYQASDTC